MVVGLDTFKDFFKDFPDQYIIIGGTACDIIIEKGGFLPRATVDIDLVLIIEALSSDFVGRFWDFVSSGQYTVQEIDAVRRICYRFLKPKAPGFPIQVELFSKIPDSINLREGVHLTPIPVDQGLSNLSAILLDDDYYNFTIRHSTVKDQVHYANTEAIICLKAFAYLDNKQRKEQGAPLRTRDILKHKYDVFRMVFMLNPDDRFPLPTKLKEDLQRFVDAVKDNLPDPDIFKINKFGSQDIHGIFLRLVNSFNLQLE